MDFFSSISKDISKSFSPDLPAGLGNLDSHLDFIIPRVIEFGEDLREDRFWLAKRWKEVRDEDGFHEAILHIFNPGGEYLLSLDGNLIKGSWRQLGSYNSLIIEIGGRSELFDLRYLNNEFMILTKHGDQVRKNLRKFFFLVHEPASRAGGKELDWRNLMEKMYNIHRENSVSLWSWLFFIIALGIILYLSLA